MTQDGHHAINLADNPFWQYSLSQYGRNNAADFFIEAQTLYDFDINVLLFIGWLAQHQYCLNIEALHNSDIQPFQRRVIKPIRQLRIKAKSLGSDEFYQSIKRLEFLAENIEQQRLFALKTQMDKVKVSVNEAVKKSISDYTRDMKIKVNKDWLQTLINICSQNLSLEQLD